MSMIARIEKLRREFETKTGVKPVKVRMGRTAYNALREEMGGELLRIADLEVELADELDGAGEPVVVAADEINSPPHYKLFPDMEVIDVIEQTLNVEEFRGYLKGNILKYRLRAGEKGPPEKCLGKANWYRRKLDDHEANWPTSDPFKEIVHHYDPPERNPSPEEALSALPLTVLTARLKAMQAEFRRRGLAVTLTVEPLRDLSPDDGN